MLRQHGSTFTAANIFADLTLVSGGIAVPALSMRTPVTQGWSAAPAALTAGTVIAFLILGLLGNFYESKRTGSLGRELVVVGIAATGAFALAQFLLTVFEHVHFDPRFLITAWAASSGAPVLMRVAARTALRILRRRGLNFRTVLLIGNNSRTDHVIRVIRRHHHYGLKVIGIVDTPEALTHEGPRPDIPILGTVADLPQILAQNTVDEVICCLPLRSSYTDTQEVLRVCEEIGLPVMMPSDFFSTNIARRSIRWLGDVPLITYASGPANSAALAAKRFADVGLSAFLLVLLSPLLLIVALLIKLTSPGPVFFKQTRVGLHGQPFKMLKFRSMVEGAEKDQESLRDRSEVGGVVFKIRDDPRITPIGKFLRRLSIDELPQLINVLRGHMSLVGPRPPVPQEVLKYDWWQRRRLSMRPGLTCIWQVSGRNTVEFEEWMEMDLRYIDNWSLGLDFRLILKTLGAVIGRTGL
ncbi:MAG: sugar transferase [Planctomycetota bacterium]